MKRLPWVVKIVGGTVAALLLIELVIRGGGFIEFPLYQIDTEMGYILQPNQSGAFLKKNRWQVNERSMMARNYQPNHKTDVLLIGDSLVIGGNPLDQAERLGNQLELEAKGTVSVWPVGAASWSALNVKAFLELNSDVVEDAEVLIWVMNSGDFYGKSKWQDDIQQPLNQPWWALPYLFKKYLWVNRLVYYTPFVKKNVPAERWSWADQKKIWEEATAFIKALGVEKKIGIVWYPDQFELGSEITGYSSMRANAARIETECGAKVICLREEELWGLNCYRDSIHPNAEGNRVLAAILAREVLGVKKE
jgi:hypothetical protein